MIPVAENRRISTTNPTWTDPGSKPSLHGNRRHDIALIYENMRGNIILFPKWICIKLGALGTQNCHVVRLTIPGIKSVWRFVVAVRCAGSLEIRLAELGNRCSSQITTQFPAAKQEDRDEPGT
jgi:hypothetical protein